MANGRCSVQWSFIMICMVDAQYSGLFTGHLRSEKELSPNERA